jgi:class 3 adenylate cyclase
MAVVQSPEPAVCVLSGEHLVRRIAAILAANVAGHSRLMGADEEGTPADLKTLRKNAHDLKIVEYRGHIARIIGQRWL